MNTYYKNDLKKALMILEDETELQVDFQTCMLQENVIPGLLRTSIRYVEDKSQYHYDISGKTSLQTKYEKEKLKANDITKLLQAILGVVLEIKKYMLEGEGLLLSPEHIFCEADEYSFCYYPPNKQELKLAFHELTEFLVREVDYHDKKGVQLAYTLHKASMEEHYSIEKILEEIAREEEEPIVRYERRLEDSDEEAADGADVAEDNWFWEPVKRLLAKRKREKWRFWEE
ncbi:MAG: DUF6382 domain-containing protein [Faecalimonas sp.]|nr:DUF6382 domain-containing protein [Faecalimonas sp.]